MKDITIKESFDNSLKDKYKIQKLEKIPNKLELKIKKVLELEQWRNEK